MPVRCCPPSFFSGFHFFRWFSSILEVLIVFHGFQRFLDGFIDFSMVFIDGFHLLRRFSLLFHGLHVFSIHSFLSIVSMVFIDLRARGKGRKLAWQGDGHESQKVAQRRSLLGDAEGHVQREAERCSLRQLSYTHTEWYGCSCYWHPQAGIEPATKLLPNQPGEGGGTGEGS